jgi:hypothetical protein
VNVTSKIGRRGGQVGVAVAGEEVCLRAKARRLWRARVGVRVRARADVRRGGQRQRQRQRQRRQRQKQAPVRARPCFVHVRMRMRGRWTRRWPARASKQGGRLCSGMSRRGMHWMDRWVATKLPSHTQHVIAGITQTRARGPSKSRHCSFYLVPCAWTKKIYTRFYR